MIRSDALLGMFCECGSKVRVQKVDSNGKRRKKAEMRCRLLVEDRQRESRISKKKKTHLSVAQRCRFTTRLPRVAGWVTTFNSLVPEYSAI